MSSRIIVRDESALSAIQNIVDNYSSGNEVYTKYGSIAYTNNPLVLIGSVENELLNLHSIMSALESDSDSSETILLDIRKKLTSKLYPSTFSLLCVSCNSRIMYADNNIGCLYYKGGNSTVVYGSDTNLDGKRTFDEVMSAIRSRYCDGEVFIDIED